MEIKEEDSLCIKRVKIVIVILTLLGVLVLSNFF